jgi:hypothetical protein
MLPHDGILPVEIDLNNLFSVEVRGQLNLLFITPVYHFRVYLRVEVTVKRYHASLLSVSIHSICKNSDTCFFLLFRPGYYPCILSPFLFVNEYRL